MCDILAVEEKAQALHALSDRVQVMTLQLPTVTFVLQTLSKLELSDEVCAEITQALLAAADCERACRESIPLFERLRRAA